MMVFLLILVNLSKISVVNQLGLSEKLIPNLYLFYFMLHFILTYQMTGMIR